jgi:hypothetical protein
VSLIEMQLKSNIVAFVTRKYISADESFNQKKSKSVYQSSSYYSEGRDADQIVENKD